MADRIPAERAVRSASGRAPRGRALADADADLGLRVPKTCATWAKALQSAVERSACAGPVLARPEVG